MTTKQLNYKALPHISTFDGSTSPTLTANDKGVMAFSTLSNKPFYWDGTQWRVATAVNSINGRLGAITLTKADVGLNSVDNVAAASLRDRTTHTGEQAISSVTGLQTALDTKASTGHTHSNATTTVAGFMSGADKNKLNSIPTRVMSIDQYLTQDGNVNFGSVTATNLQANDQVTCVSLNVNNIYGFDSSNRISWVLWGADDAYGFRTTYADYGQYDLKKTTNGALEIKVDDINRQVLHDGSVKTINGQSILGTGDLVISGGIDPNTPLVLNQDATINGMTIGRAGSTQSTVLGRFALSSSVKGGNNVAIGDKTMWGGTIGEGNVAVGVFALNKAGNYNVAIGLGAMQGSTSNANYNVAIGNTALSINAGQYNTAVGNSSLKSSTGSDNTAIGSFSMENTTSGSSNVAIGGFALRNNSTGINNTAVGLAALIQNNTGGHNTAIGKNSLSFNTTGNYNIAIGAGALDSCNGSNNIAIFSRPPSGNWPVFNITTENNIISMGGTAVTNAYIQVAWTVVSDARDKMNFAPVPHGLEFVKQLKPTAFQFRKSRESEETNGGVRYGFKAQDIAAIEPEAVIVDTTNPEKLYYNESNLIPVLVKAIQELSAEIERLKNAN